MAIHDRLAALECRAASGDLMVILIEGGLPDQEPLTITIGTQSLEQCHDETGKVFCDRVHRLAVQQRLSGTILLGGLPDKKQIASTQSRSSRAVAARK